MSDRCSSTLICAKSDAATFESMGYRPDTAQAVAFNGGNIPDVVVMVEPEATGGHYDELTRLKGVPFLVSNTACPGAFGDHLLASDGREWSYAEALWESNYPAVRVTPDGLISSEDLNTAAGYWRVYHAALEAFKARVGKPVA